MLARAAACGVLLALAVPPWGFWVLAPFGLAGVYHLSSGLAPRARFATGFVASFVLYAATLWWMTEFTPAAIGVPAIEAAFAGLVLVATPSAGRWRPVGFVAAVTLGEVLRSWTPVKGLPLGGIDLGMASSPIAVTARLGGRLGLVTLTAVAAVAIAEAGARRWRPVAVAVATVVLAVVAADVLPHGRDVGSLRVGIVQGGGRRGFRAVEGDPSSVYEAHVEASEGLQSGLDLILWPENAIDVDDDITTDPIGEEMGALAAGNDATLVAGVVEGDGSDRFRNAAVAWSPDGEIVDRFEKVRRVPFGEYIPLRPLVDKVADLSVIPRDARPGRGPGILRTPAAPLAVAVSYEVFFSDRPRSGVRAGGEVVLVPTNAASFSTSQVPTQQLAAARTRALETGRWLLQAGPTGYSAVISPNGTLVDRTVLGERAVLHATITRRTGLTVYARFGDLPLQLLAVAGLLGVWSGPLRRRSRRPGPPADRGRGRR